METKCVYLYQYKTFIEGSRGVLPNARPNYFPQFAYNWNKRATQSLSVKVSLVGKP